MYALSGLNDNNAISIQMTTIEMRIHFHQARDLSQKYKTKDLIKNWHLTNILR